MRRANRYHPTPMPDRLETLRSRLKAHDQAHVLTFFDHLGLDEQRSLLAQIETLDLESLDDLIERYVRNSPATNLDGSIEPAKYYPAPNQANGCAYEASQYRALGCDLIRSGRVAAFTVAGGQGTRLGWSGPKGTFPATVVTGKPLFRVFAEQILARSRKHGVTIPWYIMTSPINDAPTRAFFADNNYFGLSRRSVFFLQQGVVPTFDAATGRMLLAAPGEIAVNPDGHGGSLRALRDSGALNDMQSRSIEHISYFQIDNPLVYAIDPLFIGLHAGALDSSAEMSSKMVAKAGPHERVGVFCSVNGVTQVIEYSDLPRDLAEAADEDDSLRFNAGSIAVHMISVSFVQKLTADPHLFALPWHRAEKNSPYIDLDSGIVVEPEQANAVKLETFVFDAIPLAKSSIILETKREEEFAPIKNADGADSPATSHQLQSDRAGRWLAQCGMAVPRTDAGHVDAKIEISPLTALEPQDLSRARNLPKEIRRGQSVVL